MSQVPARCKHAAMPSGLGHCWVPNTQAQGAPSNHSGSFKVHESEGDFPGGLRYPGVREQGPRGLEEASCCPAPIPPLHNPVPWWQQVRSATCSQGPPAIAGPFPQSGTHGPGVQLHSRLAGLMNADLGCRSREGPQAVQPTPCPI